MRHGKFGDYPCDLWGKVPPNFQDLIIDSTTHFMAGEVETPKFIQSIKTKQHSKN